MRSPFSRLLTIVRRRGRLRPRYSTQVVVVALAILGSSAAQPTFAQQASGVRTGPESFELPLQWNQQVGFNGQLQPPLASAAT